MNEKPYEPILHRELHVHDVQKHFAWQLQLLRDIVNYGTNLIPACFHSSNRALADIVVVPVLLKQLVSMLDSYEVLVSNACIPASVLQHRSAFEASLNIDFILAGEEQSKAQHFYVANIRKEIDWANRTQAGTDEHERFFNALGDFGEALEATKAKLAGSAAQQVADAQQFLANEPWSSVNESIEREKGNRPFDPPWYAPFGPKSVRQLSNAVGRLHEYEIFYSGSSEKMHGSDYKSHIEVHGGKINMEPIRHLCGIGSGVNFAVSVALHAYRKVLERYRPRQLEEFRQRYLRDWRDPFLSVKDVSYEPVELDK